MTKHKQLADNARHLAEAFNDPNWKPDDVVADGGVTARMVWEKQAAQALRKLANTLDPPEAPIEYRAPHHHGTVKLDGKVVDNVVMCSPEGGYLERYVLDDAGDFVFEGDHLRTMKLWGVVEFFSDRPLKNKPSVKQKGGA